MKTMTRRFSAIAALSALAFGATMLQAGGNAETRLRARLSGARIERLTPSGQADFRARTGSSRLNVEVEDVNVATGSLLDVYLNGNKIGTIQVAALTLGGELELNSQDGDVVPAVAKGDVIVVRLGDRALLSGVI
jgi:hypothetical protein